MNNFKWLNESKVAENDNKITLLATEKSDYFCNPGAIGEEGITPESLGTHLFTTLI